MHDESLTPEGAGLQAEAEERWGDTEAWRESRRRTKRYSAKEWEAIKAEGAANESSFATLLRAGVEPTDERALKLAEAARRHIDRWFYDCPPAMHVNLAGLYETDPRFRAHYDDQEPGLAHFVAEAIRANAAR